MASKNDFDIFISYSWGPKANDVRAFHEELAKKSFKCWIDTIYMENGFIDDMMRNGINDSKIFICCLTYEYGNKENTMKELRLANGLKKPILYVIFEDISGLSQDQLLKNFGPVDIYLAGRLYYKSKNLDAIIKAINGILNKDDNTPSNEPPPSGHFPPMPTIPPKPQMDPLQSLNFDRLGSLFSNDPPLLSFGLQLLDAHSWNTDIQKEILGHKFIGQTKGRFHTWNRWVFDARFLCPSATTVVGEANEYDSKAAALKEAILRFMKNVQNEKVFTDEQLTQIAQRLSQF